jgi:hypothetical protein
MTVTLAAGTGWVALTSPRRILVGAAGFEPATSCV